MVTVPDWVFPKARNNPFDQTFDSEKPVLAVDTAEFAARAVLAALSDRGGFRQTMDRIDDKEIRREIVQELAQVLREVPLYPLPTPSAT